MNKKDLQDLFKKHNVTADEKLIDAFTDDAIVLHGKDIESIKSRSSTLETENKTLSTQLSEANKQIEQFKGMKIEDVQKAAEEWKAKAEKAQQEATQQIATLKFDHALDGALSAAKVKNVKAVRALLNVADLKLAEDGTIVGVNEQISKIQKENDYLFEPPTTDSKGKALPKIVSGGQNTSVTSDVIVDAARKGAGLKVEKTT